MADNLFQKEIITTLIKCSLFTAFTFYAVTWLLKRIDPGNSSQRQDARKKGRSKLQILGKRGLKLSEYEMLIASNLVLPEEIDVSWKDIAGLEPLLEDINETIIFPIRTCKGLCGSKLTKPPKGVLLHGPPGCGKTLIAKATAKEAAAMFINLDISMLTDKWYGESQKYVSALFSLAEKLQPCIIFIDEIDSILRSRKMQDHEATAMMKAQFMLHWDGLITDPNKIVIVMGATNRREDIDGAILRRMPAVFKIPLPNLLQREKILKLILQQEKTQGISYNSLALRTDNFSGSELTELCRNASLYRVREYAKKAKSQEMGTSKGKSAESEEEIELRPITMKDMEKALNTMLNQK